MRNRGGTMFEGGSRFRSAGSDAEREGVGGKEGIYAVNSFPYALI